MPHSELLQSIGIGWSCSLGVVVGELSMRPIPEGQDSQDVVTSADGAGEESSRPPTECRACQWKPQATRLWKDIGNDPRAPSVKWLWKEKGTDGEKGGDWILSYFFPLLGR